MDGRQHTVLSAPALELGDGVRGIFVKLAALEVIDVVAASSLDFAVVDLEHSQLDAGDALRLVRHGHALGLPMVVRLPAVDAGLVNRLLEAGAAGVQLSTVRRAEQVRRLRAACQYAPGGTRSVSLAHPMAGYGQLGLRDYISSRVAGPLVVAQIETGGTDDDLDVIMAARPDVIFIGLTDLTVDLGFDAGRVERRVAQIIEAALAHGIVVGAAGLDDARVAYDVSVSDVALLRERIDAV